MKPLKLILCLLFTVLLFNSCQKDELTIDPQGVELELRDNAPDYIPLVGFQPEGITMGNGNIAYVGSIFYGSIIEVNLRTGMIDTIVGPTPGSPTVGLDYDRRSKYIYAAGGYTGGVKVFDSQTGALVGYYQLAPVGPIGTTWINDLIVTSKGVYVTDSFRPFLYKIPLGPAGSLPAPGDVEEIPLSGDWIQETIPISGDLAFNGNGIDATPNGKTLIVVNYNSGLIYKVNPNTGNSEFVTTDVPPLYFADGVILKPIDNDGFMLYVCQNSNVVTKLELNEDLDNGVFVENITDPLFNTPTTIAMKGKHLYTVNARFLDAPPFAPAPDVEFGIVRTLK